MNYGRPGFLAVILFGSSPTHCPSATHRKTEKESNLLTGQEGGGWEGTESHDRKKAWSSINHSVLSGYRCIAHLSLSNLFPN
jgi:hypothetical protein